MDKLLCNAIDRDENIIFSIKYKKLYVLLVTLSTRVNQNYQNFLAKDLNDQFIGMSIKKSENKNKTNEYRYFPESNFVGVNRLFVFVYSNQNVNSKRFKTRRCHLLKGH